MQRVEASTERDDIPPLAHDVQKLVRTVAAWAAERPVVASVILFGDRLFAHRDRNAPVQIAVVYDDDGMIDGFDDWIEQLRTNFASLAADLSEPAVVLTPENGSKWRDAVGGADLPALASGKVRLVIAPATCKTKSEPSSPGIGLAALRTWRPFRPRTAGLQPPLTPAV